MAGWIPDVVTLTTITSTWGNSMRDRVVHQFASKADRDANAHPVDGMCCYTAAEQALYVRRAGAWWPLVTPWRNFTPHVHTSSQVGWNAGTVTDARISRVTRHLDTVTAQVNLVYDAGLAAVGPYIPAVILPFAMSVPTAGNPLRDGWLIDPGAGNRYKGGGCEVAAIPSAGGAQGALFIDMATGARASTVAQTGFLVATITYETPTADDNPLP